MSYATAETIAFVRKMREKFATNNGEKSSHTRQREVTQSPCSKHKIAAHGRTAGGEKIKTRTFRRHKWAVAWAANHLEGFVSCRQTRWKTSKDPAMPSDEEIAEAMQEALKRMKTREKQIAKGNRSTFSKD